MKTTSRGFVVALALLSLTAAAQTPERPIRLVVPTSPGSSADIGARAVGDALQRVLGRPVLTENRVGAGGSLAAVAVAAAEPNGETIGVLGNSYLLFALEFPQQKFDPARDVAPIAMLSKGANLLVVSSGSSHFSLGDIVRRARAEPGKLTYSSAGLGSSTYHSAERLRIAADLDLVHVPFKGSPEAVREVIAGRVDFAFAPISVAAPYLQNGSVRPIAVSSSRRSSLLPQTPTTVEGGVPGSSYDSWLVAVVPAKTPAGVQAQLSKAFNVSLETAEVRQRFSALGVEPDVMQLDDLRTFVRKEHKEALEKAKQTKGRAEK